MNSSFAKKIISLQKQVDEGEQKRARALPTFALFVVLLGLLTFAASIIAKQSHDSFKKKIALEEEINEEENWKNELKKIVTERYSALNGIPLGGLLAEGYLAYSKTIVSVFYPKSNGKTLKEINNDFFSFTSSTLRQVIASFLSFGFVLFAFSPLWIAASFLGFFGSKKFYIPKQTRDFLGFSHRGLGPFFSGIYGPLELNQKPSGTERSYPNLACPRMLSLKEAENHKLFSILKQYEAVNNTTTELIQIILAYAEFPGIVEEENHNDNEEEENKQTLAPDADPNITIIDNKEETILSSTLKGLPSVLRAHKVICDFFSSNENVSDFAQIKAKLNSLLDSKNDLSSFLVNSLTPRRLKAISKLPAHLVAASYLSTEAGKCLVFKKEQTGFSQISLFPNLQARAILQSVVSFHEEYDGELRMKARQAIICSRRHVDFGRAFLPYRMAITSRALRDWLEILFARPNKQESVSKLVELDGHIDEIGVHWRNSFYDHIINLHQENLKKEKRGIAITPNTNKGIPHKSVVLVQLHMVLKIALSNTSPALRKHIAYLINATREYQASLSVSSRLPGFKRQAQEAQNTGEVGSVTDMIRKSQGGEEMVWNWLIVRRMLTRGNWLSTRIGDDSVPMDGLVQAILETSDRDPSLSQKAGLDALVPLRKRRFKEMLGARWEHLYYFVERTAFKTRIFVKTEEFSDALKNELFGNNNNTEETIST